MEYRKRKLKFKNTKREDSKNIFHFENVLDGKNMNLKELRKYRKILLLAAFTGVILIFTFWPSPEFSKDVQNWRDSGYYYQFENYNVFYRNIYLIPRKMKQLRLEPILLILHGFPTSGYDWKNLIDKFHTRFPRIIIPDMLGLGFSDKPLSHKYTVKEQATIIENLLHSLNVSEVHMLAHDLGDTVAQELLARSQDSKYNLKFRIKSLCLTNGGIIPSAYEPRPIQKLFLLPILNTILPFLSNRILFEMRFSKIFGLNTQPSKKELLDFYSIFSYDNGHHSFSKVLSYIPERHSNEDRWVGALKETKTPLHLIYGPSDPINTPDVFLKRYTELIPQSTISTLENIGHYPQNEDPKNFIKEYFKFLDRVF